MPVRIRVGTVRGLVSEPTDCRADAALRRRGPRSRAAARSAGSSELKLSRSPLPGWSKASRWAWRNWRSKPYLLAAPVGRVADQRVPDRGEVGADLVRAAGLQAGLEVGLGAEQLEHLEMGAGLARGGAGDGHAVALARGAADRGVDRARPRGEVPLRQGEVDPLDLATLDLRLQGAVGRVVAGDDEQAAGPLVEAVDDPGALRVLSTAEHVAELADQGRARVRGRRVDDQAGRLVDHGQVSSTWTIRSPPQSPPFRCALCALGAKGAPEGHWAPACRRRRAAGPRRSRPRRRG